MIEIIPNWHPLLVHFTIALLLTATGFFIVGRLFAARQWSNDLIMVARWNLWLGALITLGTVAAGIYAYNTVAHDTPSHAAMTDHRNWALPTAAAFLALALWSLWEWHKRRGVSPAFLAGLILAAGALGVTGFKGAEVVYRHGLGVMSLPQVEDEGHGHHSPHASDAAHEHEHEDEHGGYDDVEPNPDKSEDGRPR